MNGQIEILPMAVAMVAGPQLVSAVFLATSRDPRRNSVAYIGGAAGAILLGLAIAYGTALLFNEAAAATGAESSDDWLTWVIVGLLVVLCIHTFRARHAAETPKWMTGLLEADQRASLKLGFGLFILMPTDIAVMLAVGAYLAQNGLGYLDGLPFAVLTVLLLAVPFIAYLLLGDKADELLPRIREWTSEYSWAISIAVYVFFIYAFLS